MQKKCDGKEPCQLCQDYEYVCVYSEDHSSNQAASTGAGRARYAAPLPTTSSTRDLPTSLGADKTVFDSRKGLLVDASSVLAFPRLLASSLESGQPPKLRNLVYTLGIRQERYFVQGPTLSEKVTLQDAEKYSLVFFRIVHPWHTYLEENEFMERLRRHYTDMLHDPPFEMLVAFIVALGSYFSWPERFPQEEELVEHAISWMDRNIFPDVTATICIFYVGAWLARTIYQRATANPRAAWMSSCTTMHVIESMGLHKEWDSLSSVAPPISETPSASQLDARRRIYWTGVSMNRLISTEYGRSCVEIVGANCKDVDWKPGETHRLLVETARSLPGNSTEASGVQACVDALQKLAEAPQDDDPVYIRLVRGDAACLLYRRLSLLNVRLTETMAKQILFLGQQGIQAACTLATDRQPWWKTLSTSFQFLCVLLSIDSPESLRMVPDTLRALLRISEVFDTQRTREAFETAQLLVQIASQKKEKELNFLKEGLTVTPTDFDLTMSEAWTDMNIDWMDLIDPTLLGSIEIL